MNVLSPDAGMVARLQESLPDGHLRFLLSASPLRHAWFPIKPGESRAFLANYNVPDIDEPEQEDELRLEWRNEILAVMSFLEEVDAHDPTLDLSSPEGRVQAGIERRARALSIWDSYGIPFRLRAQRVFRILPPSDAFGDPTILGVPLSSFLVAASAKSADDTLTILHLGRSRNRWRLTAVLVALVLVGVLAGVVV